MKKQLMIAQNYLLVPVKIGEGNRTISFYQGEEKIYEFEVPVSDMEGTYNYDFQAALPVGKWNGKMIEVEGEVPAGFMEAIDFSEQLPVSNCKKPLIHFAPETGWLNDPCGLLYQDGIYHLYFQHNPFSTEWGNMSWGHAVSKDLLHWEQWEEALMPDEDGTIFTGCGFMNDRGMLDLPKDAAIYIYTSAGSSSKWSKDKKFVQKAAWSTDGGKTLNKKDGYILGHIVGDNRDMNIGWHEEKQLYYAVMYLEGNDYAILNSKDLQNWEVTQRLTLPLAWECPVMLNVPVEGGGKKWVFWTADGYYFMGEFDGSHFETDGVRREAYQTMLPYAAQTFNGTERVLMIPWMRTDNKGKVRRGMMGVLRQLTLVEKNGEFILRQKLVDEFEQNKEQVLTVQLDGSEQNSVTYEQKNEAVVEIVLQPERETDLSVDIYGTRLILENGQLKIFGVAERSNGVKDAVKLGDKEKMVGADQNSRVLELKEYPEKISLLSDGEILEITIDDGFVNNAYETCVDEKMGTISIQSSGAVQAELYQIK